MAGKIKQSRIEPLSQVRIHVQLRMLNAISFMSLFGSSIYNIALPNMWIFRAEITPMVIGMLSMTYSIAYIIGPVLFKKFALKIGLKRSLFISIITSIICMTFQFVIFFPSALITINAINGVADSLFWPNVHVALSRMKYFLVYHNNPNKDRVFRKFGTSVTFGSILGILTGLIAVMISDRDIVALGISYCAFFTLFFLVLKLEKMQSLKIVPELHEKHESEKTGQNAFLYLAFPTLVIFIGELMYQTITSLIGFSYPILLNACELPSSWVYIIVFLQKFVHILAINLSGKLKVKNKYIAATYGILSVFILSIALLFKFNLLFFSASIVVVGFACGLVYSFSAQFLLHRVKGTNFHLAGINEIVSGIGFGIIPFLAGFLIESNVNFIFILLFNLSFAFLIAFIVIWLYVIKRITHISRAYQEC